MKLLQKYSWSKQTPFRDQRSGEIYNSYQQSTSQQSHLIFVADATNIARVKTNWNYVLYNWEDETSSSFSQVWGHQPRVESVLEANIRPCGSPTQCFHQTDLLKIESSLAFTFLSKELENRPCEGRQTQARRNQLRQKLIQTVNKSSELLELFFTKLSG